MEVLQRSQVTETVIKRQITHRLLVDDTVYNRHETIQVSLDGMSEEPNVRSNTVKWSKYVGSRLVQYLSKKEVKALGLEEQLQELKENDRNAYNGNGVNHYDEVKRNLIE